MLQTLQQKVQNITRRIQAVALQELTLLWQEVRAFTRPFLVVMAIAMLLLLLTYGLALH